MNSLEQVMQQGGTNRATFEFIRGMYYYYTDNPVWHIFRANALKAANVPTQCQMTIGDLIKQQLGDLGRTPA